jgi:hypothetical protein
MFILDNINDYTCLQVSISVEESIQHVTIVGGSIVAPLNLVANEGKDDGVDNIMKFATSVTMMGSLHLN